MFGEVGERAETVSLEIRGRSVGKPPRELGRHQAGGSLWHLQLFLLRPPKPRGSYVAHC